MSTIPKIKYPYRFVDPQSEYPDNRDIFIVVHVRSALQWTKILSAGLEGAYLLYPNDHHDVSVPLMEYIMSCDSIADCLLNNPVFRDSLAGIVNSIIQNNEINSLGAGDYEANEGLEAIATGLDEAWGGSKEVVEYWLDLLRTICFFIDGVANFTELGENVYDRGNRRRYGETPYLEGGQQKQLQSGATAIEVSGGALREIPQIILQLTGAISQATFVGVMSDIAQVGVSLILADINDERLEALSCELFSEITCSNGQRTTAPFSFTTEKIQNTMTRFLQAENGGLAGFAIGTLGNISIIDGGAITVFPIAETMREFGVGTRSPSDEWELLCDNCDDTPPSGWSFTFDFNIQPYLDYWSAQTPVSGQTQSPITTWSSQGWGNGIEFDGARSREVSRIEGVLSGTPIIITEMTTEYELVTGTGGSYFANPITIDSRSGTTWTRRYTQAVSGTQAGIFTITQAYGGLSLEGLRVLVAGYQRIGNNNPNGATYIRKITLKGTGSNPFV